jgi:hypothetical protein
VYLHTHEALIPWACIIGGILYTSILLFFYFGYFYGKFLGKNRERPDLKHRFFIALALVGVYCLHGLFYLSGDNFKSENLREEIRKVHPILRLSLSTLIHLDKSLIITDADRRPEDYRKMGLHSKNHSLHYRQKSGYSHAIDLRTNGRNEIRNFLVSAYFRMMGFNTLRHLGTDDHLHVSLISHDNPNAK